MKYQVAIFMTALILAGVLSCSGTGNYGSERTGAEKLKDSLEKITEDYSGEIGIALLTDNGDTVVVNNENKYPLMSVFKLHQAVSLCHKFEKQNKSIDSVVNICRNTLNSNTWSPMLKDYSGDTISVPVSELLSYTLMQSDNNASNYLFENIEAVAEVNRFISTIVPGDSFSLQFSEAEMGRDHSRCYGNRTSPLAAAILMHKVFTDSILNNGNTEFIRSKLRECQTGTDRIVAPLSGIGGISIGHKTGSGYRDGRGRLAAHNDVAFVVLPGGRYYTLAVFIKDFAGSEPEASAAIARISAAVYSYVNKKAELG